jgi:hypothetical protein
MCVCVCFFFWGGGGARWEFCECTSSVVVLLRMESVRVQHYTSLHWLHYALRTKSTSSLIHDSYET